MQINMVNLRREMGEGLNRSLYPRAQAEVRTYFNQSKKQLIRSFEESEPCKELAETAEMSRDERSTKESKIVPYGNLYAFMGFENDRNPVEEVTEILKNEIELVSVSRGSVNKNGVYVLTGKVSMPTMEAINQSSSVGFSNRGWIDSLTNGLRGLPNFLFRDFSDKGYSKSGAGIEAKDKKTGKLIDFGRGEFEPYKKNFLSEFMQKFKLKIRGR